MEVVITPDDEWFENPLDKMPIANGTNKYHPDPKFSPPPRPEEEVADWFVENPDDSDIIEEEITVHQTMYELATKNGTTITMGGSEEIQGG